MIEITCNKAERQRLTKVLLEGGCLWPQASKTCWIEGEDCRACINKRIRWHLNGRDARREAKRERP